MKVQEQTTTKKLWGLVSQSHTPPSTPVDREIEEGGVGSGA